MLRRSLLCCFYSAENASGDYFNNLLQGNSDEEPDLELSADEIRASELVEKVRFVHEELASISSYLNIPETNIPNDEDCDITEVSETVKLIQDYLRKSSDKKSDEKINLAKDFGTLAKNVFDIKDDNLTITIEDDQSLPNIPQFQDAPTSEDRNHDADGKGLDQPDSEQRGGVASTVVKQVQGDALEENFEMMQPGLLKLGKSDTLQRAIGMLEKQLHQKYKSSSEAGDRVNAVWELMQIRLNHVLKNEADDMYKQDGDKMFSSDLTKERSVRSEEEQVKQYENEFQIIAKEIPSRNKYENVEEVVIKKTELIVKTAFEDLHKEIETKTNAMLSEFQENAKNLANQTIEMLNEENEKFWKKYMSKFTEITENIQTMQSEIENSNKSNVLELLEGFKEEIKNMFNSAEKDINEMNDKLKTEQTSEINERLAKYQEDTINENRLKIKQFEATVMSTIPSLVSSAASASESQRLFSEALLEDFPELEVEDMKRILPELKKYLQMLKNMRPEDKLPTAHELEVSLQVSFCTCFTTSSEDDLSITLQDAENTVMNCIETKPSKTQYDVFFQLFVRGVIVALLNAEPIRKTEAVKMWNIWTRMCKSISYMPETQSNGCILVVEGFMDLIEEIKNLKNENEFVESCLQGIASVLEIFEDIFKKHSDNDYVVNKYLASLWRNVKCLAIAGKKDEANSNVDKMYEVTEKGNLSKERKEDWMSRIRDVTREIR